MINCDPEFLEQNIIQYPDLYLEFNNATCVVNYSYTKIDIPEEEFVRENITVTKFIPPAVKSIDGLYELLENLHNNSEEQNIYYKRKINATTRSKSILSLILGLPLCVIPPLGLYLIIKGVLGLMGLLKKEVVCCYQLPKIKISSNYCPKENIEILNNFIHEFKRTDWLSDLSRKWYLDNLCFDDGSKLLLLKYEFLPNYSTHYQYENKDGSPDLRHKNNPSYTEFQYYSFKLIIAGELCVYHIFDELNECEDMLNDLKKIASDAEIKKIKLGRDISESPHEQAENEESAEHVIESEENYTIIGDFQDEMGFSHKSRFLALLLCLFCGFLGIHDFYAGKPFKGIIHVIVFILLIMLESKPDFLAVLFVLLPLFDFLIILFGKCKDGNERRVKKWF